MLAHVRDIVVVTSGGFGGSAANRSLRRRSPSLRMAMRFTAAAVLCDLDGTLVDSSGPIRRAWTAFVLRYGADPDELTAYAHGRRDIDIVEHFVPPQDRAGAVTLVRDAELADLAGVIALPGALELVSTLSGTSWAVVTSGVAALARARMSAAGLPSPPVLVSAEDVQRGKPDPACFRLAADRLGVRAERCLVLEDAPSGIAAGTAAGATVIAVPTTHRPDQLGTATAVARSLADLRVGRSGTSIVLDLLNSPAEVGRSAGSDPTENERISHAG